MRRRNISQLVDFGVFCLFLRLLEDLSIVHVLQILVTKGSIIEELHQVLVRQRVVIRIGMTVQEELLRASSPLVVIVLLVERSVVILHLVVCDDAYDALGVLLNDLLHFFGE